MSVKKDNPSRQKPVNVQALIEHKAWRKKRKEENPPYLFKDQPHKQYFSKNSPSDFWFMHGHFRVMCHSRNWTSERFTVAQHKLSQMEPYTAYKHSHLNYSDKECLCLFKKTSKKRHYCNQEEWKEIIEIIKKFTTFKKIMFCVSWDGLKAAKIRDKEINFICETGCEYVGLSTMSITINPYEDIQGINDENNLYKKDENGLVITKRVTVPKREFIAEGYLFKIK